ncbi:hypothetical protein SAMN04488542_11573 [Fontibacillus panacisegetis]|uniref:Uncharacterized protein n=1 Tax=Fontibacillus panacisegetis TaxID=670482 RepID=A0A1G7N9Q6_9BACL|nr:hypothetical protein [Fontibacillus panacisegetis]SDF70702.1 hypothetical protein SAMN04488542_11573 [Fontibacillus panacisegetis]
MYWSFDEGSGASALESISHIQNEIQYVFNHAEFTEPCEPQWRQGVLGEGLLFDGFSTYIAHPVKAEEPICDQEYLSELSIGVWVAPRSYEWGDDGKLSAIVNRYNMDRKQGYLLGMFRPGSWSFQVGLESLGGNMVAGWL